MDGIQKTVYEELKDILEMVKNGGYGEGDDFDLYALSDDFSEQVVDIAAE